MAFTATTIWEVETGGSDTLNGGGFDTGVAGFPTDGAATVATGNSPVFTSASYNFVAGDVGAWIYIKSGTNWTPGWYKIASVAANAATLSAAIGAASLADGTLSTLAGCATTASPTGATWGVDYSQQTSPAVSFTDMVIGATTTQFTSVANPVGKNMIGNIISVASGTGFTVQRVAIVSTSTITATCDKSLGTTASTGGTGKLGGALATPGKVSDLLIAGNTAWIVGSYTLTTSTVGAGGPFKTTATGTAIMIAGYGTVRGDAVKATITNGNFTSINIVWSTGTLFFVRDLTIDGASKAGTQGVLLGSFYSAVERCNVKNCLTAGVFGAAATICRNCSFSGNAYDVYQCTIVQGCYSTGATTAAFALFTACIDSIVTGGAIGLLLSNGVVASNCTVYGTSGDGYSASTGFNWFMNCIAQNCGGFGFNSTTTFIGLTKCAGFNNTSGNVKASIIGSNTAFVTGTASFFNNPAGGDFSLNATVGGGALLRGMASPVSFPSSSTLDFKDIGAAQHPDSHGGIAVLIGQAAGRSGSY